MELNCGTHYLNAIDAYNLSLCNCRGSRVVRRGRGSKVEGRKSRVEIIHFKSFTTILKASKRGKTISFALKTEKFRLCQSMYTESFACGTKSLMRGLMFESIRILLYIGI
jgi:hypothetical protein